MTKDGSNEEEKKRVIKEAIKEWLTEERSKFNATVGEWVLMVFVTSIVGGLLYLALIGGGWTKK